MRKKTEDRFDCDEPEIQRNADSEGGIVICRLMMMFMAHSVRRTDLLPVSVLDAIV